MADEILEEVWRHRDEFAKRHGYNLDAMVAELQELEHRRKDVVVDRKKMKPPLKALKARTTPRRHVPC